jgi:hypothetical protein
MTFSTALPVLVLLVVWVATLVLLWRVHRQAVVLRRIRDGYRDLVRRLPPADPSAVRLKPDLPVH